MIIFLAAIFVGFLSVLALATGHNVSVDTAHKKAGMALKVIGYVLAIPSSAVVIIGLCCFWL